MNKSKVVGYSILVGIISILVTVTSIGAADVTGKWWIGLVFWSVGVLLIAGLLYALKLINR